MSRQSFVPPTKGSDHAWLWAIVLALSVLTGSATFVPASATQAVILECSGMHRAYNPKTREKLPQTPFTRLFKIDDGQKSVAEFMDGKWETFDPNAELDDSEISARYSHDFPNARLDIVFELNRKSNALIYLLDVDERPGELFIAHCQAQP